MIYVYEAKCKNGKERIEMFEKNTNKALLKAKTQLKNEDIEEFYFSHFKYY